jgi:C_GCAxxG_C_C family probable redox protein
MQLNLSLEEAKKKASEYLRQDYHCGPTVLRVMWEAYGLENEDFLWAGMALRGGIAGQQQATCGAVASAAVCLGLRHRCSIADGKKAEAARRVICREANELVGKFIRKFGAVTCIKLTGVDFSDEKATRIAADKGQLRCHEQVMFVIEKLFELEERRDRYGFT